MSAQILDWLSGFSWVVVRLCLFLFVALNVAMIALLVARRDRLLVQKWTSPWLAANAVLIGAGVGTLLLVGLTKFAVSAVANAGQMAVSFVK